MPLHVQLTPGQAHESPYLRRLLSEFRLRQPRGRPRKRPCALAGDKGYSGRENRRWLRERGIRAVIPYRSDEGARLRTPFDSLTYKQRNVVERCVGWLKEFRKIGTRYDKLAVNYLAFVKLAMIKRYLRKIDFSDRA